VNTTQEWLELLSAIFDGLSWLTSAFVAVLAACAYRHWRRDATASAQVEVARRLGTSALSFADALVAARAPGLLIDAPDSEETSGMSLDDRRRYDWERARDARIGLLQVLKSEAIALRKAQWEAKVCLSPKTEASVSPLLERYKNLRLDFYEYCDQQEALLQGNPDYDRLRQLRSTLYGLPDDQVSQDIEKQVDAILEALREYMR